MKVHRQTPIAFAFATIFFASMPAVADDIKWLNGGFTNADARIWYGQSQGSRLIPLAWFDELIDPNTGQAFADRDSFIRLDYPYLDDNTEYPIGFVVDRDNGDGAWLGMTCSACHTGRISYAGEDYFIHGGATWGRFDEMLDGLVAAVEDLRADPTRIESIANAQGKSTDAVIAEIDNWLAKRRSIDITRDGIEPWGPGRVDALGYIYGAVRQIVSDGRQPDAPPANAPVNPMPVWNANQQEVHQYNGFAPNGPDLGLFAETRIGAYLRNYGEALGVFAAVEIDDQGKIQSSINPQALVSLERALGDLESPQWSQAIFGELDFAKATEGALLYQSNCASCHAPLASGDTDSAIPLVDTPTKLSEPFIVLDDVVDGSITAQSLATRVGINPTLAGTDPMMACNFLTQQASSGKLAGERRIHGLDTADFIERYRETEPTSELFTGLVFRDFLAKRDELAGVYIRGEIDAVVDIFTSWYSTDDRYGTPQSQVDGYTLDPLQSATLACAEYAQALHNNPKINADYPAYKARPLNGIWATAPYLHNGSVPTLYDLLRPTSERPTRFKFNGVAFDADRVGLEYDVVETSYDFRVRDDNGDIILGNYNGGHEYGVDLTGDERAALLEYLKML